jgi:site-specific recombinase XerD
MTDKDIIMLKQGIRDYIQWMASEGYSPKTCQAYRLELSKFLLFISHEDKAWDEIFTLHTLKVFQQERNLKSVPAIRGLSMYLFQQKKISGPIQKQIDPLPQIYEDYLFYFEKSREVTHSQVASVRRILSAFNDFLERFDINLPNIKIAHIDAFLAELTANYSPGTCRLCRSFLRGFLRYLYYERKVLEKDLAPLVVGAPMFAQAKPPKFLRPQELQKLFLNLKLSTPTHIRTYAMVHLAYFMGLRPKEISGIKLKDISFKKKELTIGERKGNNPTILPVPEKTIRAIAAYVLIARPSSKYSNLFLSFQTPYRPIGPGTVIHYISKAMKHTGLFFSPYSLRHTYAQNLLNTGATIYEIKEMLGHQNIQSTKRYLHIDIELMRKVLFDEEL